MIAELEGDEVIGRDDAVVLDSGGNVPVVDESGLGVAEALMPTHRSSSSCPAFRRCTSVGQGEVGPAAS